jgi:polyphosphate kinase
VLSVVDRYLEHARVFYFHNDGEPLYLLASADWMQRNFDRRVEIGFPILESALQDRIKEILEIQLADNVKGWWMQPDGHYRRGNPDGSAPLRSQERLYELIAGGS